MICCVVFSFSAKRRPLSLVADISDWVDRILPHTVGIRDWSSFNNRFRLKPSIGKSSFAFITILLLAVVHIFLLFYSFPLMLGRTSKKVTAPVPTFHLAFLSAGMQFMLAKSVQNTSSQTPVLSDLGRQTTTPSVEIPACLVVHIVDEFSTSDEEVTSGGCGHTRMGHDRGYGGGVNFRHRDYSPT